MPSEARQKNMEKLDAQFCDLKTWGREPSGSASGKFDVNPRGLSGKEIRQLPLEHLSKCNAL